MSTDRPEHDWIARAKAGDQRAMKALHDAHAARVHSLVRRIAGDDALAEDLTQESWIRAFTSLERFRGDAQFSTWLHRIAVNTALNARRRAIRREALESEAAPKQTPSSAADAILMRVRLDQALDDLPDGMRTVLVLHDGHGYRHQDIAKMLGISAGTSKSQLFRARAKMRERLRLGAGEKFKVRLSTGAGAVCYRRGKSSAIREAERRARAANVSVPLQQLAVTHVGAPTT